MASSEAASVSMTSFSLPARARGILRLPNYGVIGLLSAERPPQSLLLPIGLNELPVLACGQQRVAV